MNGRRAVAEHPRVVAETQPGRRRRGRGVEHDLLAHDGSGRRELEVRGRQVRPRGRRPRPCPRTSRSGPYRRYHQAHGERPVVVKVWLATSRAGKGRPVAEVPRVLRQGVAGGGGRSGRVEEDHLTDDGCSRGRDKRGRGRATAGPAAAGDSDGDRGRVVWLVSSRALETTL